MIAIPPKKSRMSVPNASRDDRMTLSESAAKFNRDFRNYDDECLAFLHCSDWLEHSSSISSLRDVTRLESSFALLMSSPTVGLGLSPVRFHLTPAMGYVI